MALIGMKSVTITKKGQIAIPKDIRKLEGFKEGTKIVILAFEDRVELRPFDEFQEKMALALLSEKSFAKDWLSKEDKDAWKDL